MKNCDIVEHWWELRQCSNNNFVISYNGGVQTSRVCGCGFGADGFLYIHTYDHIYRVDKQKCTHPVDVIKILKARFPEL